MYGYYCMIKKKNFPRKTQHTLLLTPDREPMTDHNTDTIKVQSVLLKLPVGVWVQCYLQEQKWLKDIFITKAPKSLAPGAHYIACIGSSTGWRVAFLGGLVSLSLLQAVWLASASFQAAQLSFSSFKQLNLFWEFSLPLSLSDSDLVVCIIYTWERGA